MFSYKKYREKHCQVQKKQFFIPLERCVLATRTSCNTTVPLVQ